MKHSECYREQYEHSRKKMILNIKKYDDHTIQTLKTRSDTRHIERPGNRMLPYPFCASRVNMNDMYHHGYYDLVW